MMKHWSGFILLLGVACSASSSAGQTLSAQAMCAAQGEKAFNNFVEPWQNAKGAIKPIAADYTSHYNTKLGKCLIRVEQEFCIERDSKSSASRTTVTLIDAYERRIYAVWDWTSQADKYYWDVPPTSAVQRSLLSL
jgi:hypothetical protein